MHMFSVGGQRRSGKIETGLSSQRRLMWPSSKHCMQDVTINELGSVVKITPSSRLQSARIHVLREGLGTNDPHASSRVSRRMVAESERTTDPAPIS